MSVIKLVAASTEEPVTRTEAKLWLRLDEHQVDEDPLVDSLITRARLCFEETKNRSCLIQTFDYVDDAAPDDGCPVTLPKAPLVSVTSITGYQTSDADDSGGTAMSTSGYYVDTDSEFGRVLPLTAYSYPTVTRDINGFRVRFTAGYSSSPSGVPETVKAEIKALVARLYEYRGDDAEQARVLEEYGRVPTDLDLPTWG